MKENCTDSNQEIDCSGNACGMPHVNKVNEIAGMKSRRAGSSVIILTPQEADRIEKRVEPQGHPCPVCGARKGEMHGYGCDYDGPDCGAKKATDSQKLTKTFFFGLPEKAYLVSNQGPGPFDRKFAEYVNSADERARQWKHIQAVRVDQCLCQVFSSKADFEKEMKCQWRCLLNDENRIVKWISADAFRACPSKFKNMGIVGSVVDVSDRCDSEGQGI